MGAFVVFLGLALVAWAVYYIGRQIARVLWGILGTIERNEQQRAIYEAQARAIFGERDHLAHPTTLDRVSNFLNRRQPWA